MLTIDADTVCVRPMMPAVVTVLQTNSLHD